MNFPLNKTRKIGNRLLGKNKKHSGLVKKKSQKLLVASGEKQRKWMRNKIFIFYI